MWTLHKKEQDMSTLDAFLIEIARAGAWGLIALVVFGIFLLMLAYSWRRIKRAPKEALNNTAAATGAAVTATRDHIIAAGTALKPHADRIVATAGRFARESGERISKAIRKD